MHPAAGVPVGIRALEARRRCGAVGGGGRFWRPPASPRALTPAPWCGDAPLRLGLLQQWDPPSWAAGRVLGPQARGSPRAPSALQSAGAQAPVGWTRPRMCGWPLLLLWGLLPRAAAGGPGWPLPHRTLLDSEGKYWLSWGPRGGRLAFRLEVRTAGYVGFGFSPTGAMAAADIVVGGVARGRPYLQVSANRPPCSLPAEPPGGPDSGLAGAVGGRPGHPAFSPAEAGRRRPRGPAAPARLPLLLRSALAPRIPRPLGLGSPAPPPGPRQAERGDPGQLSVFDTFLSPAPHAVHAPRAHLPRTTRHPRWLRGTPALGIYGTALGVEGTGEFWHLLSSCLESRISEGFSVASQLWGWVSCLMPAMNERSPRILRNLLLGGYLGSCEKLQNLKSLGKTPY